MSQKTWKKILSVTVGYAAAVFMLSGCLGEPDSVPHGTTVGNAAVDVEFSGVVDSETSVSFCIHSLTVFRTQDNGNGRKPFHFQFENSVVELSPAGNYLQGIELAPGRYNEVVLKLKCQGPGAVTIVNENGTFRSNGAVHLSWKGDVDVSELNSVITLQVARLFEAAQLVESDKEVKQSLEESSNGLEVAVIPEDEDDEVKVEVILGSKDKKGEDPPRIRGCISGIILGEGNTETLISFPVGYREFSGSKAVGKLNIPMGNYDHAAIQVDPCSKLGDASINLRIGDSKDGKDGKGGKGGKDGKDGKGGNQDSNVDVSVFESTEVRFEGEIVVDKDVKKLNFIMKTLLESANSVTTDQEFENLLEDSSGGLSVKNK